jgi:hypothetical protein
MGCRGAGKGGKVSGGYGVKWVEKKKREGSEARRGGREARGGAQMPRWTDWLRVWREVGESGKRVKLTLPKKRVVSRVLLGVGWSVPRVVHHPYC